METAVTPKENSRKATGADKVRNRGTFLLESQNPNILSLYPLDTSGTPQPQYHSVTTKNGSWEFPGSPVVRTCAFTTVAWFQSLVGELRCYKPSAEPKKNQKVSRHCQMTTQGPNLSWLKTTALEKQQPPVFGEIIFLSPPSHLRARPWANFYFYLLQPNPQLDLN